jgi:hypothetical protein
MLSGLSKPVSNSTNPNGMCTIPCTGHILNREHRRDAGKATVATEQAIEQQRWESLSTREKFGEWTSRNQYKIILASWAVSMGVAGAIIMKDK